MVRRQPSGPRTRRRPVSTRIDDLETALEETNRRVDRLENTLQALARERDDVSIAGPCNCGESLLIIRQRTIYCPECRYRRTM